MGYKLADKIRELLGDDVIKDIDAVIPIPETSNTSAASVSERLGKKYCQGFVKNRYVFRTFMFVAPFYYFYDINYFLNPSHFRSLRNTTPVS